MCIITLNIRMKIIIIFTIFISLNTFAASSGAINIEHQVRLCEDEQSIIKKLNLNQEESKKFQTYYIETKNKDYETQGWSIRVRVKSNKTEITVKKKARETDHLENKYPNIICEYDLHGATKEYSCKLNADLQTADFYKVLKNNKSWIDILDSAQFNLLKDNNLLLRNALIFGELENTRIQWDDHKLGLITLDLVHLSQNANTTFHEISIRYPVNAGKEIGIQFENLLQSAKIKTCSDQVDWPINKFDILEILN